MRSTAVVVPLVLVLAGLGAPATAAQPATSGAVSSVVTAKDDPAKGKAKGKDQAKPGKAKPGKGKGGSSAGGNPPAHSNGKGRLGAPGQLRTPAATAADPGDASGPNPRSENENEKITYCHVPPGNPDNGHAITTSVNAIDPGHLNHPPPPP